MRRAVSRGTHCTPVIVVHLRQELGPLSPYWATPVALAVGLAGAALAFSIYRRHRRAS